MTTDNEPLPAPWSAATERFKDAYGTGEPDFDNATDRYLFVLVLEEEIHRRITRDIVESFRQATARIEAETRALEEKRS